MKTPGTYRKPGVVREIEALRVGPDETLVLRFDAAVDPTELRAFDAVLQTGPLKGRVICLQFPGEMVIVDPKPIIEPLE